MSLKGIDHPFVTLNVKDVDGIHDRVISNGGESIMKPCDLFFRMAMVNDPFGNCLGILQEPPGWGEQIGRNGEAATLDWVKIPVPDSEEQLHKTAEWYSTYLGLRPGKLTDEKDGIDLQPGNLHLQLIDTSTMTRFEVGGSRVPLLILETDHIEAIYKKMRDNEVTVEKAETVEGLGSSFTFIDPNGNAIGVLQPE